MRFYRYAPRRFHRRARRRLANDASLQPTEPARGGRDCSTAYDTLASIAVAWRGSYNPGVCTLAVYFQTSSAYPVVVAANRDEFYDRPAAPPRQRWDHPWIVAGQDLVAGGTWLGVNAHGLVAGIVNRRSRREPDPTRRSRGQLCLDVLHEASVEAACTRACADPGIRYNAFNLLLVSPEAACVVGNSSGEMAVTGLQPGLHLLTNLEVDDSECPRIAKSYGLFETASRQLRPDALPQLLSALRAILSDHSTPLDPRSEEPPNNLCVHTERFGTRSSTLLLYSVGERRFRMWHADGAPCETEYAEIALPAGSNTVGQD
ncbi:MAG: NRDE family protein [Candidatus Binatia bacterium]